MKKMRIHKSRNLKSFTSILMIVALTVFVSCEKSEESFIEEDLSIDSIAGTYTKVNSTIVNSDNGTPQGFETLKAFIGNELELLEDGSFNSSDGGGDWGVEGSTLFLYPKKGVPMNFELKKQNDETLDLLQQYSSYDNYAEGIIVYAFIKKGNGTGLVQDLLSSIEIWF